MRWQSLSYNFLYRADLLELEQLFVKGEQHKRKKISSIHWYCIWQASAALSRCPNPSRNPTPSLAVQSLDLTWRPMGLSKYL